MIPRRQIQGVWPPRVLALVLGLHVLWPARESLLLPGLPLTAVGLAAILALALLLLLRLSRVPVWTIAVVAALLVVKIAAAAMLLPTGWAARYYTNTTFAGTHEASLEFLDPRWTRIDPEIDFRGDTFPLHFFNELRFNRQADRRSPDLSALYDGYIHVPAPGGTLHLHVVSMKGLEVLVDDTLVIQRSAADTDVFTHTAVVPLQGGWHHLAARYVAPKLTARKLSIIPRVRMTEGTSAQDPVALVRPFPTTPEQESRSTRARRLLIVADVIVLATIVLCLVNAGRSWWRLPSPDRPADAAAISEPQTRHPSVAAVATFLAAASLLLVVFLTWRIPPAMMFIPWGIDVVGYEDHARYFLRGDWLLNWPGNELRGRPIPYTMGYTSMITATHALFGESMWRVLMVQDWMMWAVALMSGVIAARIAGWRAGIAAFLIGVYLKWYFFFPGYELLREPVVVFTNTVVAFVFLWKGPFTLRRAATAGALAGINYVADPPNLALLPVMLWLVFLAAPRPVRRRCLLAFAGVWLVFFLLVPARNLAVTGQATLLPTQGRATLWMGNTPPEGVYPSPAGRAYNDREYSKAVWAYAATEPRHFFTWILQKTAFSFGYYAALWWPWPSQIQHALVVPVSWMLTLIGIVFAVRQQRACLLILLIGAIRSAYVIVFFPDDRYLVPAPMALIPLTAVGLVLLWQKSPVAALAAILTVGGEHYLHTKPQLGTVTAWPSGRLFGPASYGALRKELAQSLPATTQLKWTFPQHGPQWKADHGVAGIDDGTWTFQYLRSDVSGVISPTIGVPAPLVEAIEIEGAFTGAGNHAQIYWYYDGKGAANYFPVDHTGRVRTYRIPMWQSRDWKGTIERIEIYYRGDTFEPRRIELMTYPDVPVRADSTR